MKNKLTYGASAFVSLLGLVFVLTNVVAYVRSVGLEVGVPVEVLFALFLLVIVVCEIIKIIKNYSGTLSLTASRVNACLFVLGIFFLFAIKTQGFDFTHIVWGASSIFIGYTFALITNLIVIIRHKQQ